VGDVSLTPGSDEFLQSFTNVPSQSVKLCSVMVKVIKNFSTTTSDVITVDAPEGRTIQELVSCTATIYPGTVEIVDVAGTLEVQFNATIWFTVLLDDGNVVLLSSTRAVQGVLGPSAEIKVAEDGCDIPTLTCVSTGVDPEGVSVHGQIEVSEFSCITCQYKSVKVILDPDVADPVGDPIDPE